MARQLKVSILLESIADTKGFQRFNQEMRATQLAVKKLGPALDVIKGGFRAVSTAAAVGGGALVAVATKSIQLASKINDMANEAGVSTDAIQALGYVAVQNGASIEVMSKALVQMQSAAADAANGNQAAAEKFARLGIEADRFARLKPEMQIDRLARAISSANNNQEALAAAMDLVGAKNAPKLMAALRELGEKGFGAVSKEAAAAGQVMSAKMVADLDRAGDRIELLKNRLTILGGEFAQAFLDIEKAQDPIVQAATKLAAVETKGREGSLAAAKARLEYAEALAKAGKIEAARLEFRRTPMQADGKYGMINGREYSAQRGAVAASINRAIAAELERRRSAEKTAATQSAADAVEAERVKQDQLWILRTKGIDAQVKYFAHAEAANVKLAEATLEGRHKKELAAKERHQDAISAILNRDVNDYQRRGLQLGTMRDISALPSLAPTPVIPVPTTFAPNNAGREDVKIVPQILRSIDATLKGIDRKETALA